MNNQQIEINNVEYKNYKFTKAKYFGYEILINDNDKYINITKLLNLINEEHRKNNKPIKSFYHLITTDDFEEFEHELKDDLVKNGASGNSQMLKLYYKLNEVSNEFKGTYIHEDLINYVLMWADKKYAIKISRILKELNNNNINKVNELVEELKNENQQLKQEKEIIKPKLIPVKTNELETNVKIKVYENIKDNKTYKISYDQNKYLDKTQYKLVKEYKTTSASNIAKSEGLKQYYIDKKTRVFKSDNLNEVIEYLTNN